MQVLQRSGWQVKPFDFDYFEELYDVRTVLECAAVRRLCDLQQPEILLEDLMRIWRVPPAERLRDVDTLSGLDERFHETLVEAAGNTEMARIHHDLTERLRIIRRLDFTKPPRVDATYDEHGRILDAIAHHRTEQALMMLKAHIETSRNEVRKITLHMLHEARAKGREPEAANNNFQ